MANVNTETEEDAADLQFPKENVLTSDTHNETFIINQIKNTCSNCFNDLSTPFIFCVECQIPLCTSCFSNGAEFSNHKNDHSYQVFRDDFVLFENSDWSAKEEILMLESILRYGNWNSVANAISKRNVREIKEHYDYFYLKRMGSKLLPRIKETATSVFPEPVVPYAFKINNTEDPPRFLPNTVGYSSMAGYNPARSDFECEYDGSAEDLLSNLKPIDQTDPHYELLTKLQCAIVQCYNRRLKERQRWKAIMRKHGLISIRKCLNWLSRYEITITKPVYMKLVRFMQLCEPEQFELMMEGFHRVGELKLHITRLCNFRTKGITTLGGAQLYLRLKSQHETFQKELKILQKQNKFNWKESAFGNNEKFLYSIDPYTKKRSSFTPLDILGMPEYEKLSQSEKELCSNIRLTPTLYFELKNLLISENEKMGYLKLQTARRLLKIDVNKTRKLYDFLVQERYICKP